MSGQAASSDRDALGMTRSRQDVKTRATSSGGRSLRADPRGQEQCLCAGQVEFGLHADRGDHGADRADLSGCQGLVQFPDLVEQLLVDLAAGCAKGGLDGPSFRVGGTGHYQQAAAGLAGSRDEGPHRLEPQTAVTLEEGPVRDYRGF